MSNDNGRRVFRSSLGNTPVGGRQQVLTVGDPNEDMEPQVYERTFGSTSMDDVDSELEKMKQLEEAKRRQHQANQKAPEGAKRRLEILTGIGRTSVDVEVGGITFTLLSLKAKEQREIIKNVAAIDVVADQAYELRAQTISKALYQIDGQPANLIIGNIDKLAFVEELDDLVLNHLYSKYRNMIKENQDNLNDLGKSDKEMLENVKKS